MRLMIVDDEMLIADGMHHIIENMNTDFRQIDVAYSGSEALKKLRANPYDLMIADVSMPGMDGLKLISCARAEGLCRHFCILSGYSKFEYAQKAMNVGVTQYLLKPVDKDKLFAFLSNCADRLRKERMMQRRNLERTLIEVIHGNACAEDLSLTESVVIVADGLSSGNHERDERIRTLRLSSSVSYVINLLPSPTLVLICMASCAKEALALVQQEWPDAFLGVAQGELCSDRQIRRHYILALRAALYGRYLLKRPVTYAHECEPLPRLTDSCFSSEFQRLFGTRPSERNQTFCQVRMQSVFLSDEETSGSFSPYAIQMREILEQHYQEKLTLSDVAAQIGISSDYAGRLFKDAAGMGFHDALNHYRVIRAAEYLMQNSSLGLEQLALCTGFKDVRSFYRIFSKEMNMTPGEYRKMVLSGDDGLQK